MKLSFTLLATLFFSFFATQLPASDFQLEESPFVCKFEKSRRMILVKAQVDAQEGYFLVDTGADDLILNQNYFQDYEALTNLGNYKDINGRKKKVEYLFVDQFRWGSLTRSHFYVQQLDFSAVENVFEQKILGLMGFEVFRHFEMVIDYDNEEIILSKLDQKGNPIDPAFETLPDYSFSFTLSAHLPTLEADFGDGEVFNIGLDSGSSINILDRKWKRELAEAAHRKGKIRFMGANASRKVRDYYTVDQVDVQDQFAIRFWKAAIGKLDHFESTEIFIDGIMGINFFEIGRVGINYQQKKIHVWPNPNALRWRYVNLEGDMGENLVRKNGSENARPSASSNKR